MSTPILDNLNQVKIKYIFYHFRLALLFLLRTLMSLIRRQNLAVVEIGCSFAINLGRVAGLIRMFFQK
jgi:hypothetical protein